MTTATILLYIFAAIIIFLIGVICGAALLASFAANVTQQENEKQLEDEAGRD